MHRLRPIHIALALAVAVIWGVNFVAIEIALRQYPPILLAALRFALVAFPWMLLVKRPQVQVRWIVAVGMFLGVGYFGLLFIGMRLGMPAGLSSLVLQSQAMFTLVISAALLGERLGRTQVAGTVLATAGIAVIATGSRLTVPLGALLLVVVSAVGWAAANVCMRMARSASGIGLLVWSSAVPVVPLAALSVLFDGWTAVRAAFTGFAPGPTVALFYLVGCATLLGFRGWYALLRRYPAGVVAPFSLLIPVVGVTAAWILLDERPGAAALAGSVIVLAGLAAVTTSSSRAEPLTGRNRRRARPARHRATAVQPLLPARGQHSRPRHHRRPPQHRRAPSPASRRAAAGQRRAAVLNPHRIADFTGEVDH